MGIFFLNMILWIIIFLCGLSASLVFIFKNPVHSVLSLILTFFLGSILILINDNDFVSMILITVYVGAVAVLFLFIVMMIDFDKLKNNKITIRDFLIAILSLGFIYLFLFGSFLKEIKLNDFEKINFSVQESILSLSENQMSSYKLIKIGANMYNTENVFAIFVVSLILLTAIIGVICMSLREKSDLKKQNSIKQNLRMKDETLKILDVEFRKGVDDN